MKKQGLILFCDSSSGRYIPQRFAAEIMTEYLHGVDYGLLNELADPDSEYYWDAWNAVLNNAYIQDGDHVYHLHHNGDLWLYCEELMTPQEKQDFFSEQWEA